MRTRHLSLTVVSAIGLLALPVGAVSGAEGDDRISYSSQPDRLAVFLNGIAFGQDALSLPGGVDVRVVLPETVFPDTLILRENGERVPLYLIDRRSGPPAIAWQSGTTTDLRDISLEYLMGGVAGAPRTTCGSGPTPTRPSTSTSSPRSRTRASTSKTSTRGWWQAWSTSAAGWRT